MKFSELLSRLEPVDDEADGYVAHCPAHTDSHPSLKLTLKDDGRVLVVCRASCPQSAVLDALERRYGITSADLSGVQPGEGVRTVASARPASVGPREVAALRQFVDHTAGKLTLSPEVLAYAARRFGLTPEMCTDLELGYAAPGRYAFPHVSPAFRRWPRLTVPLVDFGGVARGLQGRDLSGQCPARWLSLANPDGKAWQKYGAFMQGAFTVVLTEGPGDALAAYGAGYDAVAVRGAGLSRNEELIEELADGLRGRDVVIAGDRDKAGAAFTAALVKSLYGRLVDVRTLRLPKDAGDIGEWREGHRDAFPGEFEKAVRAAKPYTAPVSRGKAKANRLDAAALMEAKEFG